MEIKDNQQAMVGPGVKNWSFHGDAKNFVLYFCIRHKLYLFFTSLFIFYIILFFLILYYTFAFWIKLAQQFQYLKEDETENLYFIDHNDAVVFLLLPTYEKNNSNRKQYIAADDE